MSQVVLPLAVRNHSGCCFCAYLSVGLLCKGDVNGIFAGKGMTGNTHLKIYGTGRNFIRLVIGTAEVEFLTPAVAESSRFSAPEPRSCRNE